MNKHINQSQRGNVFVFVMLGVILFATLSFVVARGFRSDTTNDLSRRQAELAATDILATAQTLEGAINRIRRRGISESDISFENSTVAGYTNANCGDNRCLVFHPQGGGLNWKTPAPNANDGSDWFYTGATCVVDIGTGNATTCATDANTRNEELIAILPNLNQSVCETINDKLGIAGIPVNAGTGYSTTQFTGAFADGTVPDNMDGNIAGCFDGGAGQPGFHFYQVLLER